MKKFFEISVVMLVMALIMASCEKENIMDSVSRSSVNPTVVTDTVINTDTVWVPTIDTLVIDSTQPGQVRLITDQHNSYGQWTGTGATRTITATHLLKTTIIPDGGSAYTEDSTVFSETGTMVWSFPTYDHNVNGSYTADENGCSGLGATCTFTWTYNVPTQYAPYFEGNCEMWPYEVVVSGTTATVKTRHGNTTRTANYTIVVDVPGPTIDHYSAVVRHNSYGQWTGSGATRTITANHWLVELAHWTDGTVTRQDSVLINEHGTMVWNFPTYTSSVDGSYTATASGCTALNATCTINWTYDPFIINGRTYTFSGDCSLQPTQVVVSGTTATVTTEHGSITRNATYTIVVNIPTPADTIDLNGTLAWYFESDGYYTATTHEARRYGFFVMTNGDVYSTLRRVTTYDNNGNEVSHTDYPLTASAIDFERTITSAEYAGMESQAATGRAMAKGFHHSSPNHTYDLTMVKLESGLVSYWYLTGTWHSDRDPIGGTTAAATTTNPVHTIQNTSSVTLDGHVVK